MKSKTIKAVFLSLFLVFCVTLTPVSANQLEEYGYHVQTITMDDGTEIDKIIVPGRPPENYRAEVVAIPKSTEAGTVKVLLNVPAFDWSYGCSATSAAMIAGYYDNKGYSNMYTGPTNGGVVPMDNSVWGEGECPLSATHVGYDDRSVRGHVGDYWIEIDNEGPDPWIINGWTEHIQGDCTADYMGTNQSAFKNSDGSTSFFTL